MKRAVWLAAAGTFLIKLVAAVRLPVIYDEAYFQHWGQSLQAGFYDHPPMVGWMHFALSFLGTSPVAIRASALLFPILVGLGLYWVLRPIDERKAALTAVLFLVSPLNLVNLFVTTDTPLFLFCFASVAFAARAVQHDRWWDYALAGAMLGLAFLSKYFAVLLGAAYIAYFLTAGRSRIKGGLILVAAALPFGLFNAWWNYTHCWSNVMFNFFTRNQDATYSFTHVGSFVACQVYLATPPALWVLWRRRKSFVASAWRDPRAAVFTAAIAVPVLTFAVVCLWKRVGLHWALAFYPALFGVVFAVATELELRAALKGMFAFSALHVALLAFAVTIPRQQLLDWPWLQSQKGYYALATMLQPESLYSPLQQYRDDRFVLATTGYADSSLLSFHTHQHWPVFGTGSFTARQDDFETDFAPLQGRNFAILGGARDDFEAFFDRVERRELKIGSAVHHLSLGYGFKWEPYRQAVDLEIERTYYDIPAFLPRGPCCPVKKHFQKLPTCGG